jgi:hypothetical protein
VYGKLVVPLTTHAVWYTQGEMGEMGGEVIRIAEKHCTSLGVDPTPIRWGVAGLGECRDQQLGSTNVNTFLPVRLIISLLGQFSILHVR